MIEVRETSTLVAFVAAGLGVALIPASVRSLALDGVAYRPLSDVHVDTELKLVNRHGDLTATASTVRDLIITQLRKAPGIDAGTSARWETPGRFEPVTRDEKPKFSFPRGHKAAGLTDAARLASF